MFETYDKIMGEHGNMALATCVDGAPNVRIVTYYREAARPNILVFATEPDSPKAREFAMNDRVAFTSIPDGDRIEHVRSRQARVKRSAMSMAEAREFFSRIPGYANTLEEIGDRLAVFEVVVESAQATVGYDEDVEINFPG